MNRILKLCMLCLPLWLLPCAALAGASEGWPIRLTVDAGAFTRFNTPVRARLEGLEPPETPRRLFELRGKERVPISSQIEAEPSAVCLSWILSGTTPAGTTRVYEWIPGEPVTAAGVTLAQDDKVLEISCGERKVLRYHHAPVPPPEGVSELFTRSAFIHPLWSPAGAELTNTRPADHLHHMGLWNPWTQTTFEGREVDFWNLGSGKGTVRFAKFVSKTEGPVFGGFQAIQEHVDLSAPGGEKVALRENLDVRVWNVGGPSSDAWLVDYTTTQRCASSSPLHLLAYRYGGLGFRGTKAWTEQTSDYLSSEGKTRKDGHGTRSRWCAVYGTTEQGPAGILFMSHPGNREHPEPMRIWPEGDIFFNYCPVQKSDWTLEPGNDYVLKYRLCVYNGMLGAERAEQLWRDFAEPPQVKWQKGER
ncbi:MAG TPA: hypothetical protein ENN74_03600 [Firmicutes bacterium]|nr:hypothetical protein [Bacillota bacterium]